MGLYPCGATNEYAVRYARPHHALRDVHHAGVAKVCRESYNEPQAVYARLKRLGMDLVTVTDHDSIDAAETLRRGRDFFLSEEVTCRMPSGTELHMGVYDITERHHVEIQRRRARFRIAAGVAGRAATVLQRQPRILQPDRPPRAARISAVRIRLPGLGNPQRPHAGARQRQRRGAGRSGGAGPVGGSDAHAMASVGCAWTVVPGARTARRNSGGRAARPGHACAADRRLMEADPRRLRDRPSMVRENPATLPLAPLASRFPLVIVGNYPLEAFSRAGGWRATCGCGRSMRSASGAHPRRWPHDTAARRHADVTFAPRP